MLKALRKSIFVNLQYCLPHHLISRIVGLVAQCENQFIKKQFIHRFAKHYQVNMDEAEQPGLDHYPNFNAFFTRALTASARPINIQTDSVISPADGVISQIGNIASGHIIQAKGMRYTARSLLGGHVDDAQPFLEGDFATIYLAPKDYHRLHMPISGTLTKMIHIPGRLFSVNPTTAESVPNLFARNERIVALFDTAVGPMALVLVGAMIVASIETVWHGIVTPPTRSKIQHWDYSDNSIRLEKGAEMGRFRLGSTIIILFPQNTVQWNASAQPDESVLMGSSVANLLQQIND
jgi:phosphatidylserine decarboxylase